MLGRRSSLIVSKVALSSLRGHSFESGAWYQYGIRENIIIKLEVG